MNIFELTHKESRWSIESRLMLIIVYHYKFVFYRINKFYSGELQLPLHESAETFTIHSNGDLRFAP